MGEQADLGEQAELGVGRVCGKMGVGRNISPLTRQQCKKDTLLYFRTSLPTVAQRSRLSDCSQGIKSFGEQPI
jgi:hypothetical protein